MQFTIQLGCGGLTLASCQSWIVLDFKIFYISVKDKNETQPSILAKIKQNILLQELIPDFSYF